FQTFGAGAAEVRAVHDLRVVALRVGIENHDPRILISGVGGLLGGVGSREIGGQGVAGDIYKSFGVTRDGDDLIGVAAGEVGGVGDDGIDDEGRYAVVVSEVEADGAVGGQAIGGFDGSGLIG